MSKQKPLSIIKDLISLYVKENYTNYLKENNLQKIPDNKIKDVISKIYTERKDHLKGFLKITLNEIMKDDYIGDLTVNTICNDIFNDDQLCINRLVLEIEQFQKNL